jgi:hypothetical protein
VALLGEPPKTEYFKEFDLVYYLGPERGFMGIDSEWLVLKLGGLVPIIYLGHNQKFVSARGVYGETRIPTHFPSSKKGNLTCP